MMVAAKLATSIKSNWNIAKLGNIAERISTGTTPPSQERRYYDGDIDWFTPSDIGGNRWLSVAKKTITNEAISEKKGRTFDAGTILITCIGHIGRVGILSKSSSANQQITGIKFNKAIDPEFAYYGLFARQDELQAAAPTASTLSILNQSRLSNIDFCFPNLKEQIQISKFLSWYEDRLVNHQPFTNEYPALPNYLSELPRIVEGVDELARKIDKVKSIKQEIETDFDKMLLSAYHSIADNANRKPMEEVAPLTRRPATVNAVEKYPQVSVRSFGRGTFHKPELEGSEITWQKPYLVKSGDILISNIKAWEGAIAVASESDDGRYGSHRYLTCVPIPNVATSRFVCFHLLTSEGLYEVGQASPGSADRNRTLGAKALMQIPIPVPPIEKQLWFDNLYAKVASLRELQSATGEELSALLPSVLDRAFKGEL